MTTRFTYQQLVHLVGGDDELIVRLVDEGIIERRDDDRALVDVDTVLAAKTLWRDMEIEWSEIELILHLRGELARARQRIEALEAELAELRRSKR